MKIYLDDLRTPENSEYVIARNFNEFKVLIERAEINNETIEEISFDNDLGLGEKEGWEILNWLSENYPKYFIGETELKAHSANPVAREKMEEFIKNCRENSELLLERKERAHPFNEVQDKPFGEIEMK